MNRSVLAAALIALAAVLAGCATVTNPVTYRVTPRGVMIQDPSVTRLETRAESLRPPWWPRNRP